MNYLRKMNQTEFNKYSLLSFNTFLIETAKSSGQALDLIKAKFGNPPSEITDRDLWFVIQYDTKDIGFLWLKLSPDKTEAFGFDICLEENYRNRGIGHLVLSEAGELLKLMNINKIKICAFESNLSARQLYSKFNFKEVTFNQDRKQFTLELNL